MSEKIERNAILLSVCAHVIFFKFFILTLPIRPVMQKPNFIFLGSLLERQDFSDLAAIKPLSQPNKTPFPLPITEIRRKDFTKDTAVKNSYNKPRPGAESKSFHKITFIEQPMDESKNNNKTLAEQLGIDLTPPERIPLKLYIHDSY